MPDVPKPGRWWSKRKPEDRDAQPASCSQPENNPPPEQAPPTSAAQTAERRDTQASPADFLSAVKRSATERAAPDAKPAKPYKPHPLGPENNHLHFIRAEALAALGINPPPITEAERQTWRDRKAAKRGEYAPPRDKHAQSIPTGNGQEFTTAALPAQDYSGSTSQHTVEEFIELTERGYIQSEIARMWKIKRTTLVMWLQANVDDPANIIKAQEALAESCDSKAYQLLADCAGKSGPEVAKAAAMARFLQWRASKYSPRYADKSEVHHTGGMVVEHVTPDRPPITELVAQMLAPFKPDRGIIDVESGED